MVLTSLIVFAFTIVFASLKGHYHREYLRLKSPEDELDYNAHPQKQVKVDLAKIGFSYRNMQPFFKIEGDTPRDKSYKKVLTFTSAMTVLGITLFFVLIIYHWLL